MFSNLLRPRRTGPAVAGLALVLLASGVPATAAVSPAALAVTLSGSIGQRCVGGTTSGPNTSLTVQQKRAGTQIAKATDTTGKVFKVCLKAMKAGDKLVFTKGGASITKTVPRLELTLDVDTARANGRVPKSRAQATVRILDTVGDFEMGSSFAGGSTNLDGTFSLTTTSLWAGDQGELEWVSLTADTWTIRTAVPGLIAEVGLAKVTVIGPIGAERTVTLKDSGGSTIATGTKVLTALKGAATLKDGGSAVPVAAGQKVSVSGFAGTLTMLPDDLEVTTDGNGSFFGHCEPLTRWIALATVGGEMDGAWSGGTTESGLAGTAGAWSGPGDMPSDYTVTLYCESADGLVQRMVDTLG